MMKSWRLDWRGLDLELCGMMSINGGKVKRAVLLGLTDERDALWEIEAWSWSVNVCHDGNFWELSFAPGICRVIGSLRLQYTTLFTANCVSSYEDVQHHRGDDGFIVLETVFVLLGCRYLPSEYAMG